MLHTGLAATQSNPYAAKVPHYWWLSAPFFLIVYVCAQAAKSSWRDYLLSVKRRAVSDHVGAISMPPKATDIGSITDRSSDEVHA